MPFLRSITAKLAVLLCLQIAAVSLFAQQTSQPYEFNPVTIVAGGYVPGLIAHPTEPGLIYARTDIGSVYRWNPQNDRWIPLHRFQFAGELQSQRPRERGPRSTTIPTGYTSRPACTLIPIAVPFWCPLIGEQLSRATPRPSRWPPTTTGAPPASAWWSIPSSPTSCLWVPASMDCG